MERIEELQDRLRDVIQNTCNKVGCKDCDLKWDDGCSALMLQEDIYDAELEKELEKE